MKRLLILFNIILLSVSVYSQTNITKDNINARNEMTVRDTNIIDLIEEHSAASISSGSGITISGGQANLDGTLNQSADIAGAGNNMNLGTVTSKLQNLLVNANGDIYLNADGVIEINANGVVWEVNGNTITNTSTGEVVATLDDVSDSIAANAPIIPFNFDYNYSTKWLMALLFSQPSHRSIPTNH